MKVRVLVVTFDEPSAGAGEKAAAEEIARAAKRAEVFMLFLLNIRFEEK